MHMTSKGQVTVPKRFREKYGFNKNVDVEFADEGGVLRLIKKGSRTPFDEVYGILRSREKTDSLLEKLRGR